MRKYEEVKLPTEEEKNKSIQTILATGMPEPQKLSCVLLYLWHSIGFRGLFFGVGDCVFLSVLLSGLLWAYLFSSLVSSQSILCVLLFLASPFLYALLHLLTIWKEIMTGTYELKMACRYSLKQMTTLRMLIFGGISVVLSITVSTGVWLMVSKEFSILRIMSISFSALFLFAAIQLLVEWKWKAPASYFFTPLFWTALSVLLLAAGEPAEHFLLEIPTAVFWLVSGGAVALYGGTLKRYYFGYKEGALSHVVS